MNEYNKKPSERMIEIIEKSCGHNSKIPSDLHYYPEMIFNVCCIIDYIRAYDYVMIERFKVIYIRNKLLY